MHGSILKIKYKITVTNIGEVDYKDNEFYYRGSENDPKTNIVKTIQLQIIDYVGYQNSDDDKGTINNLNFDEEYNKDDSGHSIWKYQMASDLKHQGLLKSSVADLAKQYNTIVVHQTNESLEGDSENSLVPIIRKDSCGDLPSEYSKEIVLTKLISGDSSTDDLSYDNLVEIIQLDNEVGRRTAFSTVGNQNPTIHASELDADDSGMVIFTTPFGEKREAAMSSSILKVNKNNMDYTIDIVLGITIVILSVLAAKIIIIKRNK